MPATSPSCPRKPRIIAGPPSAPPRGIITPAIAEARRKRAETIENNLAHFYGTENWHRHWARRLIYTDGIKQLADLCGAHWLIDLIASYQGPDLDRAAGGFQLWTLEVYPNTAASFAAIARVAADSDVPAIYEQYIEYTDFPLDAVKLYVEGEGSNRVLMLPSER